MLQFSEKGEEVILRDVPLAEFAPICLFISATLLMFFLGRSNLPENIIFLIAALGLSIVFIYKLGFIQIKTVRINRQKRILSINNRSLVRNISHVYRFGEIDGLIYVETLTDKKGDKSHKLVFPLETGERIELARANSSDKHKYFEAADIINHLIFNNPGKIPQNFIGFNKL